MKKILILGMLVIALIALLSGCTTTTTTQPVTPTTTPTPATTWTPTATPTPTATLQPTATPATVSVDVKGYTFVPVTITVPKGTTVTWTNGDGVAHTVTSILGVFDSGNIAPGKTYSFTFNQAGTFEYGCTIHPSIPHGKIIVT
jgi:plastocyanin